MSCIRGENLTISTRFFSHSLLERRYTYVETSYRNFVVPHEDQTEEKEKGFRLVDSIDGLAQLGRRTQRAKASVYVSFFSLPPARATALRGSQDYTHHQLFLSFL
jgi:hypothetical protein